MCTLPRLQFQIHDPSKCMLARQHLGSQCVVHVLCVADTHVSVLTNANKLQYHLQEKYDLRKFRNLKSLQISRTICRLACTFAATLRYPTTNKALQQDQKPPRKRHKMVDASPADTLQEHDGDKFHEQMDKDIILVVDRTHHRYYALSLKGKKKKAPSTMFSY